MAKEQTRATTKRKRHKRAKVQVREQPLRERLAELFHSPPFGWGVLICALFVLLGGLVANWSRQQPLVSVGRVATDTRTARLTFTVENRAETERQRFEARLDTPLIFVADTTIIQGLLQEIRGLPATFASTATIDEVPQEIRDAYALDAEALETIRSHWTEEGPSDWWNAQVAKLEDTLRRRPILSADDWLKAASEGGNALIALIYEGERQEEPKTQIAQYDSGDSDTESTLAYRAGYHDSLRVVVASRIAALERPTYVFDSAATTAAQDQAERDIATVYREIPKGTPIWTRGDTLTSERIALASDEFNQFRKGASLQTIWLRRLSVFASIGAVTAALAGYTVLFCPRIRRNPARMGALAGLLFAMLALSAWLTVENPSMFGMTVLLPSVFIAVILVIAYEQRIGLVYGLLHGLVVCIALRQPMGVFATILVGVGVAVWTLAEIRDRRTLIRMGGAVAMTLAFGTMTVAIIDRPLDGAMLRQTFVDALVAAFGGVCLGGLTLAILSPIERLFDITTGMKLIELRDPKEPLLRELQIRAPGTYNHSLNVASISEAASDAIGANGLLTYVGALYHDIGKMNKPEYFVENQSGGPNKHDKLSPAMSLLVIVGHVKDGLEMARDYNLPRTIQHFIEGHHGTTLVEFFYHRAKEQATEDASEEAPEEFDYRYPGPKPRMKEVAIVMLADAVESATRSLAEPTPSRIDALVQAIANKRLLDGQFDECDLTLKELNIIVGSISKTVASIYHGRISYPKEEKKEDAAPRLPDRATR